MQVAWSALDLKALESFLQANASVDWRTCSLSDQEFVQSLRWPAGCQLPGVLAALKGYQRLLACLPAEHDRRALSLLQEGIHSAFQIAGMPRTRFAELWLRLFPDEAESGEQVRQNA